jgi:hypothetical protein
MLDLLGMWWFDKEADRLFAFPTTVYLTPDDRADIEGGLALLKKSFEISDGEQRALVLAGFPELRGYHESVIFQRLHAAALAGRGRPLDPVFPEEIAKIPLFATATIVQVEYARAWAWFIRDKSPSPFRPRSSHEDFEAARTCWEQYRLNSVPGRRLNRLWLLALMKLAEGAVAEGLPEVAESLLTKLEAMSGDDFMDSIRVSVWFTLLWSGHPGALRRAREWPDLTTAPPFPSRGWDDHWSWAPRFQMALANCALQLIRREVEEARAGSGMVELLDAVRQLPNFQDVRPVYAKCLDWFSKLPGRAAQAEERRRDFD